jgi:hypothetical protein
MDVNGKLVAASEVNNADVNFSKALSLSGLADGVYVVQVITSSGAVQQRIVKQ